MTQLNVTAEIPKKPAIKIMYDIQYAPTDSKASGIAVSPGNSQNFAIPDIEMEIKMQKTMQTNTVAFMLKGIVILGSLVSSANEDTMSNPP